MNMMYQRFSFLCMTDTRFSTTTVNFCVHSSHSFSLFNFCLSFSFRRWICLQASKMTTMAKKPLLGTYSTLLGVCAPTQVLRWTPSTPISRISSVAFECYGQHQNLFFATSRSIRMLPRFSSYFGFRLWGKSCSYGHNFPHNRRMLYRCWYSRD